ncbi:MAG: hypothetical protein AAGK37_18785 [Pseudomonadota bacterium]
MEYDTTRQAVVGTPQHAKLLARNIGVPIAYAANASKEPEYDSYRLVEMSVCDRVKTVWAPISISFLTSQIGTGGERDREICQVKMADVPDLPVLRIEVEKNCTAWMA